MGVCACVSVCVRVCVHVCLCVLLMEKASHYGEEKKRINVPEAISRAK